MMRYGLQFEILSRRAQMKFREINSMKRHLGVWHFYDHFHCSVRCGALAFTKLVIKNLCTAKD